MFKKLIFFIIFIVFSNFILANKIKNFETTKYSYGFEFGLRNISNQFKTGYQKDIGIRYFINIFNYLSKTENYSYGLSIGASNSWYGMFESINNETYTKSKFQSNLGINGSSSFDTLLMISSKLYEAYGLNFLLGAEYSWMKFSNGSVAYLEGRFDFSPKIQVKFYKEIRDNFKLNLGFSSLVFNKKSFSCQSKKFNCFDDEGSSNIRVFTIGFEQLAF